MKELTNIGEVMPTKANIHIVAENLLKPTKDGTMDKAEVAVRAKFLVEVFRQVLKGIEINENQTCLGAKIEVCEVGIDYDYKSDPTWLSIKEQIEPLLKKLKEQEEFIRIATKKGKAILNTDTGEVDAMPVKKTSDTSFKITLGK